MSYLRYLIVWRGQRESLIRIQLSAAVWSVSSDDRRQIIVSPRFLLTKHTTACIREFEWFEPKQEQRRKQEKRMCPRGSRNWRSALLRFSSSSIFFVVVFRKRKRNTFVDGWRFRIGRSPFDREIINNKAINFVANKYVERKVALVYVYTGYLIINGTNSRFRNKTGRDRIETAANCLLYGASLSRRLVSTVCEQQWV